MKLHESACRQRDAARYNEKRQDIVQQCVAIDPGIGNGSSGFSQLPDSFCVSFCEPNHESELTIDSVPLEAKWRVRV